MKPITATMKVADSGPCLGKRRTTLVSKDHQDQAIYFLIVNDDPTDPEIEVGQDVDVEITIKSTSAPVKWVVCWFNKTSGHKFSSGEFQSFNEATAKRDRYASTDLECVHWIEPILPEHSR